MHRTIADQVDQRLTEAASRFGADSPGQRGGQGPRAGQSGGPNAPPAALLSEDATSSVFSEYVLVMLTSDGTVIREVSPALRTNDPLPVLDPAITISHARDVGVASKPFTVQSEGSSALSYRAAVVRRGNGTFAVTAISLREANATFGRLVLVEVAATGAIIILLGLVAFWVLRLGVRPIDEMAATADAIAKGDLSRRVSVASERTEAGHLGIALNEMLHQIETAFSQRQASEDRLRRFVADASHELRTPLTSIRGYAELYRSGAISDGPQLVDAMRRIESESNRMSELVDDLLLLARLDQGRPLESEPVDMKIIVADAVADAGAVEPDRPITLALTDDAAVVLGDEPRLRQLVGNLLANVRVHTPPRTPVAVRLWIENAFITLEVADDGPGISPDDVATLFDRFSRGDTARVRGNVDAGSGAGLGLSIVEAVAEAHGGRAWVEPHEGSGASIRVSLPVQQSLS